MVTPSFTCQNPNHPHHRSHFAGFRTYPIEETVVEESTASSIVTVIDTSSISTAHLSDSTAPDILLTNHSNSNSNDFDDEKLSNLTTRALMIQSKKCTSATAMAADNQPSTSPPAMSSNSNLSHSNEAGTKSFKSKKKKKSKMPKKNSRYDVRYRMKNCEQIHCPIQA